MDVPEHVNDNIVAIDELMASERDHLGLSQRAVETVTRAIAQPLAIYLLVLFGVSWVAYNVAAPQLGWRQFDHAPFDWLQGMVTFYAAATTTCVLIAQARQNREADRRATLELHLNLLSEQKTTKIIALLEELRRDLPNVRDRRDEIAEALQEEVDPKAVHARLDPERS